MDKTYIFDEDESSCSIYYNNYIRRYLPKRFIRKIHILNNNNNDNHYHRSNLNLNNII